MLVVFDNVSVDELGQHHAEIAAGALSTARHVASTYLAAGPGTGIGPDQITETLLRRDSADPLYERLAPFEQRWAILVIRILHPVMDASMAVDDARARGASWTDIGAALGISRQTAHKRFGAGRRATL